MGTFGCWICGGFGYVEFRIVGVVFCFKGFLKFFDMSDFGYVGFWIVWVVDMLSLDYVEFWVV